MYFRKSRQYMKIPTHSSLKPLQWNVIIGSSLDKSKSKANMIFLTILRYSLKLVVKEPNRLTVFFMNQCHVIFWLRLRTTFFSFEVIQTMWQWGANGKGTQLFNFKLGFDQKWISPCKKVHHPSKIHRVKVVSNYLEMDTIPF